MITYAAVSPHPPMLIPDIGGERIAEVKATVRGMQKMAGELLNSSPDTIVFLTPHGNVFADGISYLSEAELKGDFSAFGSRVGTSVKNDLSLLAEIEKRTGDAGINFVGIDEAIARRNRLNPRLDHGILVPLYYLEKAGLSGVEIAAISIGFLPVYDLYVFGTIIREAAATLGKKVAVVASGDMSHRLKNEGPYDYHPDGPRFDETVKKLLESGDVLSFLNIPEKFRNNAGECGYRSVVIMLGALDGWKFESRVFSYEGPFGVGYLVAGFVPQSPGLSFLARLTEEKRKEIEKKRRNEDLPVKWARMVLENYVKTGTVPELPAEMGELLQQKAGAFVSLKKDGQLRGCIGTFMPTQENLAGEIASSAISAGTKDPRFAPLREDELEDLVYSVDVLEKPEPCTRKDLDPKKYGVIVSRGSKRGLLLPDIEGVDSVEEQLAIALQKAGISPEEEYRIERFKVRRYI